MKIQLKRDGEIIETDSLILFVNDIAFRVTVDNTNEIDINASKGTIVSRGSYSNVLKFKSVSDTTWNDL